MARNPNCRRPQPFHLNPEGVFSMEEYTTLLRQDLMTFTLRAFQQLNPQVQYAHNWHLDLIADRLEACRQGKIRRLIINVPPRSLKSILASVALPAFWLGHNPSAHILCASYGQDLADKLSSDCRQVMASDWYQALFPTRLSKTRNAVQEFNTTANGSRMATSVGGVVTGRGADLIIIDDPLKPEEAVSDLQRQKVNDWYDSTLFTRLNQKETGVIIVIMQRLHMDDLVGHLVDRDQWEVLSLPAIAEAPESFTYMTPRGEVTHLRQAGELLHPEREPQAVLDELRRNLGEYAFAGQYQQAPYPAGGAMVKEAWLMVYEPAQLPKTFDQTIMSWDTANKASELADFSVCTVWGYKKPYIYLLEVFRKKLNYPELKQATHELKARWNSSVILIEDKASGTQLIQELQRENVYSVKGVKPEGEKKMRMNAQTGVFERGMVFLPAQAPWLEDYRKELISFPKSKQDDQVDSTSQALKWIHDAGDEPGIITYMREEVRRIHGDEYVRRMQEKIDRERGAEGQP
jgi:predicted phage terminase large subunit-like protein